MIARLAALAVTVFAWALTGVRANWLGCLPAMQPRVYFGNHNSHADFVLIWTVLPPALRRRTRPVAGADYWLKTRLRAFIGRNVFNAVLIDRDKDSRNADPVALIIEALDAGSSLILFPEGTRNTTEEKLLPFKTGLYHLARQRPAIELVPVWIDNLNRVLPKGEYVPVPLLCTVTFGTPLTLQAGEDKAAFLTRARDAMLALAPASNGTTTHHAPSKGAPA